MVFHEFYFHIWSVYLRRCQINQNMFSGYEGSLISESNLWHSCISVACGAAMSNHWHLILKAKTKGLKFVCIAWTSAVNKCWLLCLARFIQWKNPNNANCVSAGRKRHTWLYWWLIKKNTLE